MPIQRIRSSCSTSTQPAPRAEPSRTQGSRASHPARGLVPARRRPTSRCHPPSRRFRARSRRRRALPRTSHSGCPVRPGDFSGDAALLELE
jgi:hypothetical protein